MSFLNTAFAPLVPSRCTSSSPHPLYRTTITLGLAVVDRTLQTLKTASSASLACRSLACVRSRPATRESKPCGPLSVVGAGCKKKNPQHEQYSCLLTHTDVNPTDFTCMTVCVHSFPSLLSLKLALGLRLDLKQPVWDRCRRRVV